jgi:ABC-type branched-subunit amino acid transport system substrate-binding protein
MTRTRRSLASWLAVAMLLSGVVAGCGGKGDDEQAAGGGEAGALKTGPGVTDSTITLGLLTDLSGVFAALGKPVVQGTQLYWDDANAAGGVCDRTVKLTVKDHGYDPQKAVVLYRELSSEVAALQQMLGSPMTAALLPTLKRDSMLSMLAAWPSGLLGEEVIGILGATYDIETENGLEFAMKAGKLKEGDKIGHIYFEGDYGESGLEGSKRFAEANGMTVVEQKIKATDEDMSGQVSALKRQGVKAVALSTSPAQTASAVGVGAAQGLTVPYVGNGPTWDPALLKSPAAEAVKALLFVSSSVAPFSKEGPAPEKAAAAFTKAHAKETPKASVQVGWAQGRLMYETLKKACENQDLSREGIVKAFHELSALDLEGLTAGPLDYTQLGESPSTATHVAQPAEVAGGLKVLEIVEGGDSA